MARVSLRPPSAGSGERLGTTAPASAGDRSHARGIGTANPSTPIPEIDDGGPAVLELGSGERFEFDAACSLTYDEAPGLSIRCGGFANDGKLRLEAIAFPLKEEYPGIDPGEWFMVSVFDSDTYEELRGASLGARARRPP